MKKPDSRHIDDVASHGGMVILAGPGSEEEEIIAYAHEMGMLNKAEAASLSSRSHRDMSSLVEVFKLVRHAGSFKKGLRSRQWLKENGIDG